jgi:hypothetical protein
MPQNTQKHWFLMVSPPKYIQNKARSARKRTRGDRQIARCSVVQETPKMTKGRASYRQSFARTVDQPSTETGFRPRETIAHQISHLTVRPPRQSPKTERLYFASSTRKTVLLGGRSPKRTPVARPSSWGYVTASGGLRYDSRRHIAASLAAYPPPSLLLSPPCNHHRCVRCLIHM